MRVRNFRLYFLGQTVSIAGTWMQNVGLSWLILQLSHNGATLGAFTGLRFLPLLLLGPWGGLVADKSNKRRLLFATQVFAGALSATLALLVWLDAATLWSVFLMGALLGLVNVFDNPARNTLIYEMVEADDLANAISLTSILANIARVVGPLLAGVIIAGSGVSLCFALNAVSFIPILLSIVMMRASELRPAELVGRGKGQIRAGFRYIRGEPDLAIPLVMVAVAGAFAWEFQVTFPLVATKTFHGAAWTFGAMLSAVGIGAIVGGLIAARRRVVSTSMVAWASVWWGVTILVAAAAPTLPVEFVILLFVGYGTISFNSLSKVCLQVASDSSMRGRVMALWAIAWQGTTPVGGPVVGWVGQYAGARWSLVAGGLPTVVVGLGCLWYLRFNSRRTVAAAESAEGL